MKKLLLIFTLLFSTLMFSTPSYGEWTKMLETNERNYYVDIDSIRKQGGYIYFWQLSDYFKPSPSGRLSGKIYKQVDCKLFRIKVLSDQYYNERMGRGPIASYSNEPDKNWRYPSPNSINEKIQNIICQSFR